MCKSNNFQVKCTAAGCNTQVSYSDQLSSHVIVRGLENADIQEKVLACEDGVRGKNVFVSVDIITVATSYKARLMTYVYISPGFFHTTYVCTIFGSFRSRNVA